jgi:hypothetical protein
MPKFDKVKFLNFLFMFHLYKHRQLLEMKKINFAFMFLSKVIFSHFSLFLNKYHKDKRIKKIICFQR